MSEDETPNQLPDQDAPSDQNNPQPDAQPEVRQPVVTHSDSPHGSRRIVKLLVLLVLVIIVAGGGVWYAKDRHKTNTTNASVKRDIPLIRYGTLDGELPDYPLNGGGVSSVDSELNAQLFEGLVRYQNQTKIVPLLATSWSNPDDSTWLFTLRQGIKFHTGRTFTAADVKTSLDYAVAHQNDVGGSNFSLANTIKEVDVVNPYQVKVITNGPDPTLLNRLAYMDIFDSKAKLGDYDAGTGPYVIKPGTTPSNSSMDLVAYNGYWGGHVYTRELDVSATSNTNTLVSEIKSGKLDIAGDFSAQQLSSIKSSVPAYQPLAVPDLGITFLGLNTEKAGSPLQSLAARQAAAYALDVPQIIKTADIQAQPANQLVPSAIPGHDPSISDWPYNPTKAKQLLSSVKNANAPLTVAYPSSDPGAPEAIKELNAVGFNVKGIEFADLDTMVQGALSGQYDMYFISYSSNILDGLDILSSILQGNSDYDNPQIDNLATQAGSTLDPASRIKLLQQIAQLVHSNVPDIPVYNADRVYALTKPYNVAVDIPSTDTGIYFWKVYQQ